jgi:hypothetical protein
MRSGRFVLEVQVEVTDGEATAEEIIDALLSELDVEIETDDGAVVSVTVSTARRGRWPGS